MMDYQQAILAATERFTGGDRDMVHQYIDGAYADGYQAGRTDAEMKAQADNARLREELDSAHKVLALIIHANGGEVFVSEQYAITLPRNPVILKDNGPDGMTWRLEANDESR